MTHAPPLRQETASLNFRMNPEGLRRAERRLVLRFCILLILALAAFAVFYLWLLFSHPQRTELSSNPWLYIPLMYVVTPAFMLWSMLRARRQLRDHWVSFELRLVPDSITRAVSSLPDLTIDRSDVTRIEELANGTLIVRTATPPSYLYAPSELERLPLLRQHLELWHPITPSAPPPYRQFALALIAIAGIVIIFAYPVPWLVLPLVPLSIGVIVWAFIKLRRDPHATPQMRRAAYLLVFPLISLVGSLVLAILRLLHYLQ